MKTEHTKDKSDSENAIQIWDYSYSTEVTSSLSHRLNFYPLNNLRTIFLLLAIFCVATVNAAEISKSNVKKNKIFGEWVAYDLEMKDKGTLSSNDSLIESNMGIAKDQFATLRFEFLENGEYNKYYYWGKLLMLQKGKFYYGARDKLYLYPEKLFFWNDAKQDFVLANGYIDCQEIYAKRLKRSELRLLLETKIGDCELIRYIFFRRKE